MEKLDTRPGLPSRHHRHGGKDFSMSYTVAETSIGPIMLAATEKGLRFIRFGKRAPELLEMMQREYPSATFQEGQFSLWEQALEAHLQGNEPQLALPLDVQGTPFQVKVWQYLQKIPYGTVQTYAEVAKGIGQPSAIRAVAGACAANALAIAIPCHRVIRSNGELGGYRWGLSMKQALIDRESRFTQTSEKGKG